MSGTVQQKSLAEILGSGFRVDAAVTVSELALDSRAVVPGAAFLACQGRSHHGLRHVHEAVAAGARVILWEPAPGVQAPALDASLTVLAVPGLGARAGLIADRFFDAPSAALTVIGITGTNGKTTCAWLLAQALERLGTRAAYFGTLGQGPVEALQYTGLTTADAISLQRALAAERAAGRQAVAMEVSSHALDQRRTDGVRFSVAAFTNLSRDHLDYHHDMRSYGEAKARLFHDPPVPCQVINADDAFGRELAARAAVDTKVILTTRRAAATHDTRHSLLCAEQVTATAGGLCLALAGSFGRATLTSPLLGEFNADNLLTVLGVLLALGHTLAAAVTAVGACSAAPGRMEASGGGASPLVVVDYAHTPDALAKALRAARQHTRGKLWCVFGCGGDRDAGKRPLMGRAASELADAVIITDDNPRTEKPAAIAAAILAGTDRRRAEVIHDRAAAIASALQRAGAGDVVLVAGKGHEREQLVGAERRPFHDTTVVRNFLQQRRSV
jgi:UDP-N-acetylmuramoyl-L-alanyl-D-glutamate--2,6-diaminopimelate ligase